MFTRGYLKSPACHAPIKTNGAAGCSASVAAGSSSGFLISVQVNVLFHSGDVCNLADIYGTWMLGLSRKHPNRAQSVMVDLCGLHRQKAGHN